MTKGPKPFFEHVSHLVPAMRLLARIGGVFSPSIRASWQNFEQEFSSVKEMMLNAELFAGRYAPLGWVLYDRMSTEILAHLREVEVSKGEEILTNFHLSEPTLKVLAFRFQLQQFEPWRHIYERAIERCKSEDWISAVPLLLIAIDGICTTSTGKHPFSGGADAEVFDSFTSSEGGLSDGLRVLGATRRKFSADPINAPFRHGIVHGLNPRYDSAIVAAKALNLLQATTDYFQKMQDESTRLAQAQAQQAPVKWSEIKEKLLFNAKVRKTLDAWRPRAEQAGAIAAHDSTNVLEEGTPEKAAAKYLSLLLRNNYGEVAALTVDYPLRPLKSRAGRLRQELQGLRLVGWSIVRINDHAASLTQIQVLCKLAVGQQVVEREFQLRMMYADDQFEVVVRGMSDGKWFVMPNFTTDLWVLRNQVMATKN